MKDFFISYISADLQWAEWIAWQLEEEGYTTIIQAWDFPAGGNFVLLMQNALEQAERMIALISPGYFIGVYTMLEWAAAFTIDPTGEKGTLIPVRVEKCELKGLQKPMIYIDLFGVNKVAAKNTLLQKIRQSIRKKRPKPDNEPDFPSSTERSIKREPRYPGTLPPVCNLPRRNPNFTGRESILETLRTSLQSGHHIALTQQALYGLGGIGKTQLAIEYAWRYSASYDIIWWLRSEEPSTLASDYAALAFKLNLPEKDAQEQGMVIDAVKEWLNQNTGWLLIFDNAEDTKSIFDYLPTGTGGHLLITSRYQNWKHIGTPQEIKLWSREESIAFLYRRTGQSDDSAADNLAEELGFLPLALEQAAAYVCTRKKSYSDYLDLFTTRRAELWKREKQPDNYPDTVATTWSLAFEKISHLPYATDILNVCSIVASDAIPWKLVTRALDYYEGNDSGASSIDTLLVDDALESLITYSLITPEEKAISIHRLVQTVVQERMLPEVKEHYCAAAIKALSEQFPCDGYRNPSCWPECDLLLSHAEAVIVAINNDDLLLQEIALLQNSMALFFLGRAAYEEARLMAGQSLENRKKLFGDNHFEVAKSLSCLGEILYIQSNYFDAEELLRKALGIQETKLGVDHLDVAVCLDLLGFVLHAQWKSEEWETLLRRALEIRKLHFGDNHLDVATSLNNLGFLLHAKGRYSDGEYLLREALEIREEKLNKDHPDVARSLNILADLLQEQEKYAEAELLFRRALRIRETVFGKDHPVVATSLNDLGLLCYGQGKFIEGEKLLRYAIEIKEKKFGKDHPITATSLNNLGLLLCAQDKCTEALPLLLKALEIRENKFGTDHPKTATSLNDLGLVLRSQHKYSEAEPRFRRALEIREAILGVNHPKTIVCRDNLRMLKREMQ